MTATKPKVPAPAGMAPRGGGLKLWRRVVEKYDLRPDELRILEDACREADLIDRMVTDLKGKKLTTFGSTGQLVTHPLVSEIRQHRSVLKSLIAQLRLPDDDPAEQPAGGTQPVAGERSSAARAMANARWSKRGT